MLFADDRREDGLDALVGDLERPLVGLLGTPCVAGRDESLDRGLVSRPEDVLPGDDCRPLVGLGTGLFAGLRGDLVFLTCIGSGQALGSGLHGFFDGLLDDFVFGT